MVNGLNLGGGAVGSLNLGFVLGFDFSFGLGLVDVLVDGGGDVLGLGDRPVFGTVSV